jgi:hypothetical protein
MQAKLRKRRGQPDSEPPPLTADPEDETTDDLPAYLYWIWESFAILSRTRLVNEAGPQPITVQELHAYCLVEGRYDEEQRRELLHHITILDIEWLKVTYAKIATNREKAKEEAKREGEKRAQENRRKGRRR